MKTIDGPEKIALTLPQARIMGIFRRWRKEQGVSPSIRDLAQILDRNVATIHQHLQVLVKKGALVKLQGSRRQYVPWTDCATRAIAGSEPADFAAVFDVAHSPSGLRKPSGGTTAAPGRTDP